MSIDKLNSTDPVPNSKYMFNNEAFGIVAIASVLKHSKKLSYSKALLILPLMAHKETLILLKRENSNVRSIEQLIAKKENLLTNFNERYLSLLPISINSIVLLNEIRVLENDAGIIEYVNDSFDFNNRGLGKRAQDVIKASKKISSMLEMSVENLYLQLRVHI
ncbi:three component ABC system middle component [Paenibacillus sp. 2KB_22]|uniref:three component ABC system middle component n=1 Tax=Paenibacillus sp. 2KB_22 TaxID=3232978 RepID=UPI003F9E99F1